MAVLALLIPPALLGVVLLLGRWEQRFTEPSPDRPQEPPSPGDPETHEAISGPTDDPDQSLP
ncbi:hypothetical protein ACFC1R_06500 [Kitasatospora sp. NPDC056138]|uniref:hypothetical protein n=1 Tax=Kitasatospora sp. NPDC056138 TaxID=3345724 RepID=UPI0035DF0540